MIPIVVQAEKRHATTSKKEITIECKPTRTCLRDVIAQYKVMPNTGMTFDSFDTENAFCRRFFDEMKNVDDSVTNEMSSIAAYEAWIESFMGDDSRS